VCGTLPIFLCFLLLLVVHSGGPPSLLSPPHAHPFHPSHTPPAPPSGSYVANRVSDKLTPLHERIYCCRSGSAADTQALADYARRALSDFSLVKSGLPSVSSAAHIFRKMCYDNKDRLSAGIIVAGWDAVEGGQVYEIPLGGTCVRGNIALGGSGSTYIHGFVDSAFRVGESLWWQCAALSPLTTSPLSSRYFACTAFHLHFPNPFPPHTPPLPQACQRRSV
jgi:hypothetical protein